MLQVLNDSKCFSVHLNENKNEYKCLYLRMAVILSTNIVLVIINSKTSISSWEFESDYTYLAKTVSLLLVISENLYSVLPHGIFPVSYMLVCHCLLKMLKSIKEMMEGGSPEDFENITKSYIRIRRLVGAADDVLSIPMFLFCLFHAVTMHFCVTCLIHPSEFAKLLIRASHWILFLGINFAFICMSGEASLIYEYNIKLGNMAQELMAKEPNPSVWQKNFVSIVDKEMSLSVWKITSVKRSFILVTLGTVLTYSILFDSLRI
ncbi:hypothetical protein HNY73_022891 [Argiope bruennichi]|uniref:Uncharacterized protein n=1 Tax=Argiope bruennichi TaxID=94029 RepID=A0A8T0E4Q2_ARGBR|nr:hypothetical protein HNY73_022891 [Argiope bruennichi]